MCDSRLSKHLTLPVAALLVEGHDVRHQNIVQVGCIGSLHGYIINMTSRASHLCRESSESY